MREIRPVFPGLAEPPKLKSFDDHFGRLKKPKKRKKEDGLPRLKPEEYFQLFVRRLKRIPNGLAGADGLIRSHLKLVPRIAKSMRKQPMYGLEPFWSSLASDNKKAAAQGYGIALEELASAGFVGLLETLGRFDPARGAFSTCADDNIRKTIRAEISFLYQTVKRAGWAKTLTDNRDESDCDKEDVDRGWTPSDLDVQPAIPPSADTLHKVKAECLIDACSTLTPHQRRVFEDRFRNDFPTLRELGEEYAAAFQGVGRAENAARKKIADTLLPLAYLVCFYVFAPTDVDDWLDEIRALFYADGGHLGTAAQIERLFMHALATYGRADHSSCPLKEIPPERRQRFRGSDRLLQRCLVVTSDGVAQPNRWLPPPHHKEYVKEKKEVWRKQNKNPLWRPPRKSYPCRQFSKEECAAYTPSCKRTPFWARPQVPFRENRRTIWVKPPPGFVFTPGPHRRRLKLHPLRDPYWPDRNRAWDELLSVTAISDQTRECIALAA